MCAQKAYSIKVKYNLKIFILEAQTGNANHIDILTLRMTLVWYVFYKYMKLHSNAILAKY